jgi:large subunit ribosomal protein L21
MTATKTDTKSYAIISLGGKQYVVREGERLLVDRLGTDEGKTFHPGVLFVGGDGAGTLAPHTQVTARVVGHVLGDKVRIGKYRPKSGYRRHTGFRARLSQIEIESIGSAAKRTTTRTAPPKQETPKQEARREEAREAEPRAQVTPKDTVAQPPKEYPEYTVADIAEKSKRWRLEQVEAALEYERANANRKGALAALEATIAAKQEKES